MIIPQIILSCILIVSGFLVEKYPNLIAGYNTMSEAEKKQIDITNLSGFLKQLLIGLGIITFGLFLILNYFKVLEDTIYLVNSAIITIVIIIGIIYSNKKFKL